MTIDEALVQLRLGPGINEDVSEEYNEAVNMAIKALEQQPNEDCISRQAAIDALWKALHEYEDKIENQFLKSKELDVTDWFQHRIFVQNMSDIDRQTILNLSSVTPQSNECEYCHEDFDGYIKPLEKNCHTYIRFGMNGWVIELKAKGWRGKAPINFCPMCGRRLTNG